MYIKKQYPFWMTFLWSKEPFIYGFIYALGILATGYFFNLHISLPWQPIGVVGIAVSFYLGFKNNSSYDRLWEARKIYGGIVNDSRSFAVGVNSFIQGDNADEIKKEVIYRHIAWLTALRYQLRLVRPWEHIEERVNSANFRDMPTVSEDYLDNLDNELEFYLSEDERKTYQGKTNIAAQILKTQSARMQELCNKGYFDDFRHMELYQVVSRFCDGQGKAERIKNFPLPRQYSSTANYLTRMFCFLAPLGLYPIFHDVSSWKVLLEFPFISGAIIWIFCLMEKIGDYTENPFEGTYNDVPITQISRAIEIDLREMINDENIPAPITDQDGFVL